MTSLHKWLLLPCLSPLLAALVVAGLNWREPTALRLLTWRTGKLPIGAWIALAAVGSAVLTGGVALTSGRTIAPLRRQVHRPIGWDRESEPLWPSEPDSDFSDAIPQPKRAPMAWPERDVRDPAPTVAVPFKVIKRRDFAADHSSADHSSADHSAADDLAADEGAADEGAADYAPPTSMARGFDPPTVQSVDEGSDDWDQPLPGGW
ncbi:MAG: hypothetical protein ACON4T_09255 [Synechococcus sp.]